MVHKRSVVAGFFAGGIILALGLALIFSKDWAWSLFETFYSMLGIQAQRRRLLEMFITTIGLGKLFKYELEELVLAAVVTSGGPMNGAAIATSKGWHALVVPSLLIGIWGYIIGNYTGYLMGVILGKMF